VTSSTTTAPSADDKDQQHPTTKSGTSWPVSIRLNKENVQSGRWDTVRWSIADLRPRPLTADDYHILTIELHLDQRTAYRFNLNSQAPCLFVLCHESDVDNQLIPVHISASQDEASSYMDGEHHVLSAEMPVAICCWIEAYLSREGELIDSGRKKKKSGKGRSSGN
jgi:hypothetical protein